MFNLAEYIWALAAAFSVVSNEMLFVVLGNWIRHWYIFCPLAIVSNYLIFRLVSTSASLIEALVTFSLCVSLLRLAATALLNQPITRGALVAFALLMVANVIKAIRL